jgi:hypothetical protein
MAQRPVLATAVVLLFLSAPISAQIAPPVPNDYSRPENWLCRPDRADACSVDLTATVITADGTLTKEYWKTDPDAPVDCFYVYPTVSADMTPNSDMTPGTEEREVVAQQFARFGSACRLYAPLYRQVTVQALMGSLAGKMAPANRFLPYTDVLDAWRSYLANDNRGRGVVLIGHSQGSQVLTQLLINEIDGKPIQARLVSAILAGWNLSVPVGKDVGGAFTAIPLCRSTQQVGCIVTYASFRSSAPPPPNALFGRQSAEGRQAACTNPASLPGGAGELRPYFRARSRVPGATGGAWTASGRIDTPYVTLPGLLTAECLKVEQHTYLGVTVRGNPADPRADDIPGDMMINGERDPRWGLHLVDVNLALGNLVDIVRAQVRAYGSRQSEPRASTHPR